MPPRPTPARSATRARPLEEATLQQVLGYQLASASIVTSQLFELHVGAPFELRPVEYTVLTLIAEKPGGSLAQIARELAVTAPNITVMVDRLESRGLIQRRQSDEDRRTQVLHTTPAGAELVCKATGHIVAAEKEAIGLTRGEREILLELLHKVAGARVGTRSRSG